MNNKLKIALHIVLDTFELGTELQYRFFKRTGLLKAYWVKFFTFMRSKGMFPITDAGIERLAEMSVEESLGQALELQNVFRDALDGKIAKDDLVDSLKTYFSDVAKDNTDRFLHIQEMFPTPEAIRTKDGSIAAVN